MNRLSFNSYKLGDVTEIIAGGDKPKEFKLIKSDDFNVPVYANAEGDNGLQGYTNVARIIKPSVTVSARGSKVGFTSLRKQPFFPIVRLLALIPKEDLLDVSYLYYSLKYSRFERSGSGQPQITIPQISNKVISIPDLPTQQKIAAVLSALDDKIELNNKINAELEAMAKTLYDYWFVQFDFPFDFAQGKTNEVGKPYKSSGGKMVYNPTLKREIPEGWEVKSLFESAKVQYGFPFSTDYFNEDGNGIPVIRIRDILNNSISNFSTQENIDEKYLIEEGDVLIGMDGNFHVNYWTRQNCYLNQRVVMIKETELPNILLRYQVEPYIQLREKSVSRTTVGHLSDKDLKAINIIVPTESILNMIKSLFDANLKKIIVNSKQNQELAQLRDWLLPMLMNGQVKVE